MKTKSIPFLLTAWLLGPLALSLTAGDKAQIFDFGDNPGANAAEDAKSEKKSFSTSKGSKSSTSTTNINGKSTTVTRSTGDDGKETVIVTTTEPGHEPKVEVFTGEEYDKKNGAGKPKFDAKNAPAEAFDMLLNDPNVPEAAKALLRKMRKEVGVTDADEKKQTEPTAEENHAKNPAADKKTKSTKATE
jgi:hypothetical protein